jgi:hypothetical protein
VQANCVGGCEASSLADDRTFLSKLWLHTVYGHCRVTTQAEPRNSNVPYAAAQTHHFAGAHFTVGFGVDVTAAALCTTCSTAVS